MDKKLKIIFAVLGALILLGGIGAWYAIATINPVQLAGMLSSSVKAATGRDLKISGPITLSVFPSISVTAERVSLSNATWASESDMLKLARLSLDVKILPLISKRIEIGSIKLSGLELYLQANAAGKGNWEMSTPPDASATSAGNSAGASTDGVVISMESLSVQDARIEYREGGDPASSYQVQRMSLEKHGDQSAIQVNMKYRGADLAVSGKTAPLSKVLKDWNVTKLQVPVDLEITLNDKSIQVKGDINKAPNTMLAINLALNSKSFDWPSGVRHASTAKGAASSAPAVPTHSKQSKYLFDDAPLPMDVLPLLTGKVTLDIASLGLPGRKPLQNLKASLLMSGDAYELSQMTFQLGEGQASIHGKLSQFSGASPALLMQGTTKDITLEAVMASLDPSSKVGGGKMKVAFDLRSSGKSLHQLAGNSSGKIQATVDQAKTGSNFLNDSGDFVVTVLDAMNPLRKKSSETVLECVVIYLPISNGQVNIANTIGAQTDRLNVIVAGSMNLKTEAVNLTIDPKERSGLTTGLDLAGLVKIGGTLANPKAAINQAGVVTSAVSIGLGILTGGATILAENAKSIATKSNPCQDAFRPWSEIYPGAQ